MIETFPENLLDQVISRLPATPQKVIRSRYGIGDDKPKTYKELAELFGYSISYVNHVELTARRRLHRYLVQSGKSQNAEVWIDDKQVIPLRFCDQPEQAEEVRHVSSPFQYPEPAKHHYNGLFRKWSKRVQFQDGKKWVLLPRSIEEQISIKLAVYKGMSEHFPGFFVKEFKDGTIWIVEYRDCTADKEWFWLSSCTK